MARVGKTILFITHDVEEALFLSNRVLVVEQQPITTLTERTVPLDHNRTRKDLYKPEVLALKDELLSMLQGRYLCDEPIERISSCYYTF